MPFLSSSVVDKILFLDFCNWAIILQIFGDGVYTSDTENV